MTALVTSADRSVGRVVVGLDSSPSSVWALHHGARLAEGLGLVLVAITVWHRSDHDGGAGAAASMQEVAVATAFGGSPPQRFERRVLEGESVATLLAESEGADYLVLGSHVHGSIAGLMLGSVTAACTVHARCAVVVCHSDVPSPPPTGSDTRDIVVGIDGTEASLGALRQGARFAQSMRLPLLAICARGGGTSPVLDAGAVLAAASQHVFGSTPPRWFRSSARDGTPEAVLGLASEHARMLVIGHSAAGAPTTSDTSVSSLIASRARCPVVVFHLTHAADPDSLPFERRRAPRESSLY